jgi:hypothetical protein
MEPLVKEKKPRSQAQIDAFEKARSVRQANMRKQIEAEQAAEKAAQKLAPAEEEEGENHEAPAATPRPPVAEKPVHQAPAVDDVYDTFDASELVSSLNATRQELEELRNHVNELNGKHGQLHDNFMQHGINKASSLNFV